MGCGEVLKLFPLCDPTSCSKHCCVGGRTAGQRHNSTVCVYPFILTLHHAAAQLRNSETAVRTQTWTTRLFSIESAVCCKGPGQNPSLLTFAACNYKVCSFHPLCRLASLKNIPPCHGDLLGEMPRAHNAEAFRLVCIVCFCFALLLSNMQLQIQSVSALWLEPSVGDCC